LVLWRDNFQIQDKRLQFNDGFYPMRASAGFIEDTRRNDPSGGLPTSQRPVV
jgi:hypothetical protein